MLHKLVIETLFLSHDSSYTYSGILDITSIVVKSFEHNFLCFEILSKETKAREQKHVKNKKKWLRILSGTKNSTAAVGLAIDVLYTDKESVFKVFFPFWGEMRHSSLPCCLIPNRLGLRIDSFIRT